jgi:sec-independent protein translocase protein TatA
MFGLGVPELLAILVVVLVIFGPSRLPQVGQALGSGIRGFKKASRGEDDPPENALSVKDEESSKDPE